MTVWSALPQSNTKHTVKLMLFGHSKSWMETKGSLGLLQMTAMLSVKHGVEIFSVWHEITLLLEGERQLAAIYPILNSETEPEAGICADSDATAMIPPRGGWEGRNEGMIWVNLSFKWHFKTTIQDFFFNSSCKFTFLDVLLDKICCQCTHMLIRAHWMLSS